MDDIIINLGHWGKQDYDTDDIGNGIDLICVNNPDGYNFIEGTQYRINGMGGLVVDEDDGKLRIGFGKNTKYGYCLSRDVPIVDDRGRHTSDSEWSYIYYDDLVRNFLYASDTWDDRSLIERARRDRTINNVLENG
tara:strand:- start:5 stop:412 length:408 start_codon:yes stop_codon:yes gene_type:complete